MVLPKQIGLAAASLLITLSNGWAATLQLALTDDAWINGNKPANNYGTVGDIVVHNFGPKQGLVRFDAAPVTGETINSATLEIYLSDIRQNGTVSVHAITSSWNETSVTWNSQPPAESVPTATVAVTTADAGSVVTFDVKAAVQRWSDGSLAANGFLVVTSDGIKGLLDSKENSAGTPAVLQVDTTLSPSNGVGTPPIVLNLSNPPVVIDEPGYYVLDQNWNITGLPINSTVIDMQVNATIDFRGFEVKADTPAGEVVTIGSGGGTLLNGRINGEGADAAGVVSRGPTVVKNMFLNSNGRGAGSLILQGPGSSHVSNSDIRGGGMSLSGAQSSVMSCRIGPTLFVTANQVEILGNRIHSGENQSVEIVGNNNTFAQNVVEYAETNFGFYVAGNENLVFDNSFEVTPGYFRTSPAIRIDGSRNFLKDNILLPGAAVGLPSIGIQFLQDGNYYRNNQMSAAVPFDLGGTVQNDLGGNVGY